MNTNPKQWGIYWCFVPIQCKHAMSGNKIRPCIVTSNNINNEHSATVQVIPMTSKIVRPDLPTHVIIANKSTAYIENMTVIDKTNVIQKYLETTEYEKSAIKHALQVQFDL